MNPAALTAALKEESLRLGFDLAGATPAAASPDLDRLSEWLSDGYAGQMRFIADRLNAYRHPCCVLQGVKSILMLGMNYRTVEPIEAGPSQAVVSRCAWGADYHAVIRERLHKLANFHRRLAPAAQVRGVVDTAPLLEKRFGQLAGLGSIGKNTTLINPRFGSWFFLAALLTTEDLVYDEPAATDCCGPCRACLDACPTGALVEPGRLDARRCISYLTIESRDDEGDRGAIEGDSPIFAETKIGTVPGDRLFGCDACQEACPWNRQTPSTAEPAFYPGPNMNPVDVSELLRLDEPGFRRRFRRTPLWRATRAAILRKLNRND
jgi:epoxyqueuosine reductase